MKKIFLFFLFWSSIRADGFAQVNTFQIITQDLLNFWEAYDRLSIDSDTANVFQQLVLDRASSEFKVFINKWNIKATHYRYFLRRFPRFYQTLRSNSLQLIQQQDSIRSAVARFQALYPHFKAADICIGIGNFSTGGNVEINNGRKLVYIGLEFHGLGPETTIEELPADFQDYVSRSNFHRTIIHELAHIQQYTNGKSVFGKHLINRVLAEGIPDFIAHLIVPQGNDGNHTIYGLNHEKELREKLKTELWQEGSGDWFGGELALFKNHPRDLGYFMGAQIARSHYNKYHRLLDLLEVKNIEQFLAKSTYFDH